MEFKGKPMRSDLARLLRPLRKFRAARRGNVAITFALAAVPMIGVVGAAIDYGQATSIKADFQSALDSTVLMLAKEAVSDTPTQLQANATNYFNALFKRPEAKNVQITAAYSSNGGSSISVAGSATMSTNFAQLIGYNNFTVSGAATSKWSSKRLRVSLVLDNTGSMSDATARWTRSKPPPRAS